MSSTVATLAYYLSTWSCMSSTVATLAYRELWLKSWPEPEPEPEPEP